MRTTRCLKRNQKLFYYALFLRREENESGCGSVVVYGDPVPARGNISASKGTAETEPFGIELDYDKVIVLDDPDCPINESTALFIDREPERNEDGDLLFDYIVKKVAPSLNSVSIAIKKVDVS